MFIDLQILLHVVLGGLKRCLSTVTEDPYTASSSSFPSFFSQAFVRKGNKKLLELGGGMTCLAALGLASCQLKEGKEKRENNQERGGGGGGLSESSSSSNVPPSLLFSRVTMTDGNPSSVIKQQENIALNGHLLEGIDISSHVLFWEPNDESKTEEKMIENIITKKNSTTTNTTRNDGDDDDETALTKDSLKYDLIIGADLLFFESHGALASCLDRLLSDDGGGGMVLLCQPSRGGTMEKFARHPEVVAKFNVKTYDTLSFDPIVAELHSSYLSDPSYDPTIHSPSLLCLTRV
jgi:hypothetical protein